MTLEEIVLFDLEADNLLPDVSVIHCLSYQRYGQERVTLLTKEEIADFIENADVLIGHSIILYDLPVLLKIYGIEPKDGCLIIDTLAFSWYLKPMVRVHGLESYGEELELPKIEIKNWKARPIEEYILRCERDVDINMRVFLEQYEYILEIYEGVFPYKLVGYLMFKMQCLADQEYVGLRLDVESCKAYLAQAEEEYRIKEVELIAVMPVENAKIIKSIPKVMYKQDGDLSANGEKWFDYLDAHNLPFDTKVVRDPPNPGSHTQLKKWLVSIDWKPQTFKISKSTGKRLPQVSRPYGKGLCKSIIKLYPLYPELKALEGFYMIKHRVGLFKSFLENERDGRVTAGAHGFTNTLRLGHKKPIANLPKPSVPWGKKVRGVLIADDGQELLGDDISGLESATADHYIYFFDPKYVEEKRTPGFDPHTDLGVLANLITPDEEKFFKWYKENNE